MTRVLQRGLSFIILAASLSGCMSLTKRIEDNLASAEELSRHCERLENAVPIDDELKSFTELFKSRIFMNCGSVNSSDSCESAVHQITKLLGFLGGTEKEKEKKFNVDKKTEEKIGILKEKLTKLNETVSTLQEAIQANIKEGSKAVEEVNEKFINVKVKCRYGTFFGCRQAQSEFLKELNSKAVGDTQEKIKIFGRTLEDFKQELTSLKKSNPVAQDSAFLGIVDLADQIVSALTAQRETLRVVTTGALDEFVKTFFQQPIPLATAEKLLGFIERQLEPVDHLVEKIDDKSYFIASFATYQYKNDIQAVFNDFYVRLVRRVYPSSASALGFARAACARLSHPSPPGKRMSLITPFIFESMTLIGFAEKRVNRCVQNEGTRQAKQCEIKEVEKIKQLSGDPNMAASKSASQKKVISNSLKEKEAPLKSTSLSGNGIQQQERQISQVATTLSNAENAGFTPSFSKTQQICWGTEIRLRQALSNAGKTVSESMLAEMTARACGEVILAIEQEQFIKLNGPQVRSVNWQSEAANYQTQHFSQIYSNVTQNISQSNYIDSRSAIHLNQVLAPRAPVINCQGFRRIHSSIACFEHEKGLRLMIGIPFQTTRWKDDKLVPILRGIATELRFNPAYESGKSTVTVVGGASQKKANCTVISEDALKLIRKFSSSEQPYVSACASSDDANQFLALARAAWSGNHLKAEGVEDIRVGLDPRMPENGNKPFDRQVAIEIQWR